MKLTTDIPCPYGVSAGKDCIGCLSGEQEGKYVTFTCNECGTLWGVGTTDDMSNEQKRREFGTFSNKVNKSIRNKNETNLH